MSEKRTFNPRAARRVAEALLVAPLATTGVAEAQESQSPESQVIERMRGVRVIGGIEASASKQQLSAEGAINLPGLSIPVRVDESLWEGGINGVVGVAYTRIDPAEGDFNQIRALVGVEGIGAGDSQTSLAVCNSNIQNNRWGTNACLTYDFENNAAGGEFAGLRRVGDRSAIGLQVTRDDFGNRGNTSIDAVARHDFDFIGPTMLRAELAVGRTLEGGLAYGEEMTENRGNSHVGLRLELSAEKYYAGPILGGRVGIAGGPYLALEAGHAWGEASAQTPFGVNADLETEATEVRLSAGFRF